MDGQKKPTSFKLKWIQEQAQRLRRYYSPEEVSNDELKRVLLAAYEKRYSPVGRMYNNLTKDNEVMKAEDFINEYLNGTYVLTGYNVLVGSQSDGPRPINILALEDILDKRKFYKKKMQAAEKGSAEYIYNKVMQLTFKVLANSWYGIQSMGTSMFYNPWIQNSITTTGQDAISVAIYLVESLLANNERFKRFEEILAFVDNVAKESKSYECLRHIENRKSIEDVDKYLESQSDFELTDRQRSMLMKLLGRISEDDVNKVYYKNQLLEIFKNGWFAGKLERLAAGDLKLDDPEWIDCQKEIVDIAIYDHLVWDRFVRISKQTRKASIVTDTDSTFCYLGSVINRIQTEIVMGHPDSTIVFVNMLIGILSDALDRILRVFTVNCNVPEEYRSIMNLKNEFVYSRIMTTRNKKNYAGWLYAELGKPIPGNDPSKHLDIKGLSIRKTTVAKSLRAKFQNLLVEDILTPERISVPKVMKDYDAISDSVEKSIRSGETEFLLPKSVDTFDSYKNPLSIEQVKATMIWNAVSPNDAVTPPDSVNLIKIAAKGKNAKEILDLKDIHPDIYEKLNSVVFEPKDPSMDLSKNGFTAIAIPLDMGTTPEWILPLIDYDTMVNANVKNANVLLESLGLKCTDDAKRKANYKSNIVEWL
jgi:hypothetical protein